MAWTELPEPGLEALRASALACSACVALLALLALVGWLSGHRLLASFGESFVPMAPNTALCFLALGAALGTLSLERLPWCPRVASPVVAFLALARLFEFTFALNLGVDDWFLATPPETLGLVPVGQMSFFTALSFLLLSLAVALAARALDRAGGFIGVLCAMVAGLGLAFTLGYVYGAPLLYGGATIPMALNTSVSFVLLSGGLLGLAVRSNLLERQRVQSEIRSLDHELRVRLDRLEALNRELEESNRRFKETQMYLIHSEKMASLGQLVAGVAHEINNPLACVITALFTVKERLARLSPELEGLTDEPARHWSKARQRLSEMHEGLERVRDLVVKLRTFSRLDEAEFKDMDVRECVDSVLTLLRHRLAGRVQVQCRYGAETTLTGNPGQLNQVLMNLVANAVQALPEGGEIGVCADVVGNHLVLEVSDRGVGIPETIRHRIFDPFFTTKPVGEGTGLGLSICYGIVSAHQGTIEVTSREGEGTTFTVRIPRDLQPG